MSLGKGASAAASMPEPEHENDVDPHAHVPADQTVVSTGIVWKLNTGADPKSKDDWLRRKMWLTNVGGLFYYSRQQNKPLGRTVRGLNIVVVEGLHLGRHLFEVHPVSVGSAPNPLTSIPTILACDTMDERDGWVKHLRELQTKCGGDGLEENVHAVKTHRRRMSGCLAPPAPIDYGPVESGEAMARMTSLSSEASEKDESGASRRESHPKTIGLVGALDVMPREVGYERHRCASIGPSIFGDAVEMAKLAAIVPPEKPDKDEDSDADSLLSWNSQEDFSSRSHTFIVLDWDDTLFPTTWIRNDLQLNWKLSVAEQLEVDEERIAVENLLAALAQKVEPFLRLCHKLGHVFIVTLARRPWVDLSAKHFMPIFEKLLVELGIKVIYARDAITDDMERDYNAKEFRSSEEEIEFWMRAKAKAMELELNAEHNRHNRSWKNIMSIGDSDIERRGLISASKGHMAAFEKNGGLVRSQGITAEVVAKDGHLHKLRTKTLKMLDDPSVEELTAEIAVMTSWLPFLVKNDDGIDLQLEDSEDDDMLNKLHKDITGLDEKLSWLVLAGMDG